MIIEKYNTLYYEGNSILSIKEDMFDKFIVLCDFSYSGYFLFNKNLTDTIIDICKHKPNTLVTLEVEGQSRWVKYLKSIGFTELLLFTNEKTNNLLITLIYTNEVSD